MSYQTDPEMLVNTQDIEYERQITILRVRATTGRAFWMHRRIDVFRENARVIGQDTET
jgi:hypothetical protein